MSWGGAAVGPAPYQAPPFPNSQPSFGQPQPFQYGQQGGYPQYQPASTYPPSGPPSGPPQRPPDNRPPKKKGNPIITRYPPPPGYRGPAQPPGQYAANQYPNQYQPPPQPYQQPYSAPASYAPQQGYSAPPSYPNAPGYPPQSYGPPQQYPPAASYPPAQPYQYPQNQQPPQAYSQPPNYSAAQSYPPQQAAYQQYPPQPAPVDTQVYAQPQGWQPPNGQIHQSPQDMYGPYSGHSQDPNATPTPSSAHLAASQSASFSGHPASTTSEKGEKPQLFLAWDDWDFDFDGAIWPKSNEPVDPNLSLGVIIWRPAKQVTRALPSTWAEAEEQALKPPAEKLGNGESVSIYFTWENSHEAFLDVRQTDEWHVIKDDPIFVVFPDEKDMDLIPLEECIAKRDRPDEPLEEGQEVQDTEMGESSWNVMDNLEQALSGLTEDAKPETPVHVKASTRDQQQEDILAMLGVTGTPKPPSNEPFTLPSQVLNGKPPMSLPPKPPKPAMPQPQSRPEHPPQRAQSYSSHHTSNPSVPPRPYGSISTSTQKQSLPPPPPDLQEYDPWNPRNSQTLQHASAFNGRRVSEARSEGSAHTLAGSDFGTEKPADGASNEPSPSTTLPPVPTLERSDSSLIRKRSYEDADNTDENARQHEDHSKRKRRSQIASAYSRR